MNLADVPRMPFAAGDELPAYVARIAAKTPDRIALISGRRTRTFRELDAAVSSTASALVGRCTPGERAALLAANSIEYVEAFLGALRAGLCVVPLPTMASAQALGLMLEDSGAAVLFASSSYRAAAEQASRGKRLERIGFDFSGDGWTAFTTWCAQAPDGVSFPPIGAGDAFDVMYSSGTTGVPKGIVHTHAARKASYAGSRARYFSPDTINVVATPFCSNTTCVTWFLATAVGGVNVVLEKFSVDAFCDAVESHGVTHAMLVPVQYERLLDAPRFLSERMASLTHLFCTSAPLRADTKRKLLDHTRAELIEIYGLTEGGPVTVLEARKHPGKLASVGTVAPGCDVRVVDESGRELPAGQTGEVVGRSSNLMSGYLNRPADTQAAFLQLSDGSTYFRTGDLGRFDAEGFLHLLDRKKDVIISGGFNVYASDLEAVLLRHPDVLEACVFGVPSERWGETPMGLVVLRPGRAPAPAALLDWCNAQLGKVQRLAAIELRDELPKNAIGKILKRELRAPYWVPESRAATEPA